ncbi:MAG: universal stress protein [Nitrososphaeraceae archaeon]
MASHSNASKLSNRTSFNITKILVAIDGSDIALGAAMAAIQLAEKYSAELVILYVIDSKIRYETIGDDAFPRYLGSLKQVVDVAIEKGQKLVDEVKEKVNGNKITIKTEVLLGVGSVVKEIVEYAEKEKIDLIILGTRGISGIKKVLLGSTASGVVTYSHCPVMIIK